MATQQATPAPESVPTPPGAPSYAKGSYIEYTKFDKVPKLTGSGDYASWRDAAELILTNFGAWDIMQGRVLEPIRDPDDLTDYDMYINKRQLCITYLIQTVDPRWISILATHKEPPRIWKALEDKFARENATAFYTQFQPVYDLKLTNPEKMKDHLLEFDTNWNRLQHRCSSARQSDTNTLPYLFHPVLASEQAKAVFLLLSLPQSMENIVDNLQTKQGLTYDDAYQRLIDIADRRESGEASDDKAYKASEKKKRQPKSSNTEKECTYCKKHYPQGRYTGHTWNECFKLKRDKESKTKDSDKDEQAKVTSDDTLSEATHF